jgi:hypothetical protein
LCILSNTEEYVRNRLDDQIKWYSEKSAFNKSRYRLFQVVIIIASGTIPILNLTVTAFKADAQHAALFTSSILGSIITIITAFLQMEKYFDNWILYRTTAESLKREKILFQNNAGEYSNLNESEKNRILVERVEAMLSSENAKFFASQQQSRAPLTTQETQQQPQKPQQQPSITKPQDTQQQQQPQKLQQQQQPQKPQQQPSITKPQE